MGVDQKVWPAKTTCAPKFLFCRCLWWGVFVFGSRFGLGERWFARAVKNVTLVRQAYPAPTQTPTLPHYQQQASDRTEAQCQSPGKLIDCE